MFDHLDDPLPPDGRERLTSVHREAGRRLRRQRLGAMAATLGVFALLAAVSAPVVAGARLASSTLALRSDGSPRAATAPSTRPDVSPRPTRSSGGRGGGDLAVAAPAPPPAPASSSAPLPSHPTPSSSPGRPDQPAALSTNAPGRSVAPSPPATEGVRPAPTGEAALTDGMSPAPAGSRSPVASPDPTPTPSAGPSSLSGTGDTTGGAPTHASACLRTLPADSGPPIARMTLSVLRVGATDATASSAIRSGDRFQATLGVRTADGTSVQWRRDDELALVLLDKTTGGVAGSLAGPVDGGAAAVTSPGPLPVASGVAARCDGQPVPAGDYTLSGGVWVVRSDGVRVFWQVDRPLPVTVTPADATPTPAPGGRPLEGTSAAWGRGQGGGPQPAAPPVQPVSAPTTPVASTPTAAPPPPPAPAPATGLGDGLPAKRPGGGLPAATSASAQRASAAAPHSVGEAVSRRLLDRGAGR